MVERKRAEPRRVQLRFALDGHADPAGIRVIDYGVNTE